jgi:putative transposase
VALSCRGDRPVLAPNYRLVNETHLGARARVGRDPDGSAQTQTKEDTYPSDQGSQFGSDAWRRFCREHHLEPSMSRRGNCWDNAVAESFFSSLKKERIKKRIYKNRDIAKAEIYDYIEVFYNRTRRHSHLSGVSPEVFEAVSKPA